MAIRKENECLVRCLRAIEEKLSWGPVTGWSNYDFDKLSDRILDATGVRLSATTLKRVWGRIAYKNDPSTTTLNALARYAGEEDWRAYVRHCSKDWTESRVLAPDSQQVETGKRVYLNKRLLFQSALATGIFLGVILLTGFLIQEMENSNTTPDKDQFAFEANKVYSQGVPNSVIFTYDASQAQTDSVFIIQTWDYSRKTLVSKENINHSAIYYYPGFFRTALVADGQVVKQHDLQIATEGWLGLVELPEKPYYFKKEDFVRGDTVEINKELLTSNNFDLLPEAPKVRFYNQRDLGTLSNDNFEFHTELKNNFDAGNNTCHNVEVLIQCKDDIIIIPLMAPSCVGDARLYIPGKEIRSSAADLSGFGANLSEWTGLNVICRDRDIQFFVNGKEAIASRIQNEPTGIVGVQIRFNGPGAVRNTWFIGDDGRITL